jgi:oligopeptide/dipeptide ABC transporter ATP-binding protein
MYAGRIVEQAPAAALFAKPRHPYTIGLLAARPERGKRAGERATGRLRTIPGMVPAPQHFPAGCRFHPRCAFARLPECAGAMPELREVATGHFVRCPYADALGEPRRSDESRELIA